MVNTTSLPAYLTTLYSIPHGCNVEIYNLIRLIVMQEMFHFALVGNILIALGEVPEIDSPNFAPSYPGPRSPSWLCSPWSRGDLGKAIVATHP
jgi:hypothetical protein